MNTSHDPMCALEAETSGWSGSNVYSPARSYVARSSADSMSRAASSPRAVTIANAPGFKTRANSATHGLCIRIGMCVNTE